ncbi:hypothetical protein PUN28_013647 [Cardiocondyla obscurior]|uniref:Uncharacterized protein n=1 Tax=Cardiocondyla obscurior TaxID=286306 RepID=A0AAW2F7J6_9HYME
MIASRNSLLSISAHSFFFQKYRALSGIKFRGSLSASLSHFFQCLKQPSFFAGIENVQRWKISIRSALLSGNRTPDSAAKIAQIRSLGGMTPPAKVSSFRICIPYIARSHTAGGSEDPSLSRKYLPGNILQTKEAGSSELTGNSI